MSSDEHFRERRQLERVITFSDYIVIGFGTIIGVGWVVYAGQWLVDGGALGAVLAFIIGGALFVPVGKCYAEMTSAIPVTGGEVAFTYKAYGPTVCFLTAWALSLSYIIVVPFETIAIGAMIEAIFPAIVTDTLYEVGGFRIAWSSIIPGVLAGIWIALLNWRNARDIARFQTAIIFALTLCTMIFCSIAFLNGDVSHLEPLFAVEGNWQAIAPASIASVLVVVPFFLMGFDCIPQAAEESGAKMEPRRLGIAIITAILVGVVFYVLIVMALAYSISREELKGIVAQKDVLPMAEVFRTSLGYEWAAKLVLFTALLGIISTLNGIFMASTRLLFAQGRSGLLPQWFAELHPEYHTPRNAIFFVAVLAVLGPFWGKAGLSHIISSTSLMFTFVFFVITVGTLRLRYSAPDLKRPYRTSLFSIYTAILVSFFLIALMLVPGSPGQMGFAEIATAVVWMILGIGLYLQRRLKKDMSDEEQEYMILGEHA